MKLVFRLVAALVVLVILGVVALFLYIDAAAKAAVQRGGTYALGVQTTLDSADVQLLGGRFEMRGLRVANPPGFDHDFLKMREGGVNVTLASLREETVELPQLALTGVDLTLERKEGRANYQVITDNLKRFESTGPPPEEKAEGKKYVIREILIRDVNVSTEVLPIGGDLTRMSVPIKEIRLENVGSGSDGGVIMSELTSVILQAIFAAVLESDGQLPGEILNDLRGALGQLDTLREMGVDLAVDGQNLIGDVLKGATEVPGGVIEGAGKTIEGIGKGIEDLIGGDKGKKKNGGGG
jgi:hypothetical protein